MGNFNNLPQEIILEILTRLPTESVLECKLVCKPWRNLACLPCFSQMHLSHLNDTGKFTFLCKDIREQLNYLEYNEDHHEHNLRRININPPFRGYTISGSCNGLICLKDCHDSQPAYICNPITKEYVILPKCNRYNNPTTYHLYDGFGYLRETNEYKVVIINQLKGKPDFEYCVEVYSLGSGSEWRNLGDCELSSSMGSFINNHGVFVNDSLYWITSTGKIVCFILADEKFCEIPAVPCLSSGMFLRIGVLSGVLWCSNISIDDMYVAKTATWFLNKNGSQRMMVMEQEKYLPSMTFGKEIVDMKPLSLMKSGEVLCYSSKKLYSYDIKSCGSETLMNFPQHIYQTIPHMNTLVSLKGLGEEDTKQWNKVMFEVTREEKNRHYIRGSSSRQNVPYSHI